MSTCSLTGVVMTAGWPEHHAADGYLLAFGVQSQSCTMVRVPG